MVAFLKTGLIGAGHFGRLHAQKSLAHPFEKLIGIVDKDVQKARLLSEEIGVPFFEKKEELFEKAEALLIATPATTHYGLGKDALEAHKHVFLEKPLSVTAQQGKSLLAIAEKSGKILQIGHFLTLSLMPALILERIPRPHLIKFRRMAPFSMRGTDVSVILDLMIHDLEFLFSMMGEVGSCDYAKGEKTDTDSLDRVSAAFSFSKNCRAELFASRSSSKVERFISFEDAVFLLEADFISHNLLFFRKEEGGKKKFLEKIFWQKQDLLKKEHEYFTQACLKGEPVFAVQNALSALLMAEKVQKAVQDQSSESSL